MEVNPGLLGGKKMSRFVKLIHCYYWVSLLRLSLAVNRMNPTFGDWCATHFGITSAYHRGRALLGELPRTGNAI
jgi:hypothetical protein